MQKGSVRIDEEAVEQDARFDGKFVLTTNTELPAEEVATTYKGLWRVERTFRHEKSTTKVRPLFHHRDDTSIGHIVASFLALRLEVDLQGRLEQAKFSISWPDLMRDLSQFAIACGAGGTGRPQLSSQNGSSRSSLSGLCRSGGATSSPCK